MGRRSKCSQARGLRVRAGHGRRPRKSMNALPGRPALGVVAPRLIISLPKRSPSSASTSKQQHWPIDGPIAARMLDGASTKLGHLRGTPPPAISEMDAAPIRRAKAPAILRFESNHQDRHAVGGEYPQHDTRLGSDDAVARRSKPGGVAGRGRERRCHAPG